MTTKTLADYIQQAEAWVDTPARGDDFAINIREECLVESHIVDVVEDGVVLAADDRLIEILESYGMLETADPYRREVSPPSPEEFEEDVAEDKNAELKAKAQMKKMYGDGVITFSKTSNGGYFIQHEDNFGDTNSHQYDPATGKVDFRGSISSTYYGEGVAEGSLDTPGIEESQAELARIQELAGMPPAAMPAVQEGSVKNWVDDLYYEFQERHDLPRDIDDDAYLSVVAKFLQGQGIDPDKIEDIGELFLDMRDREEDDDHDYANQLDRELYDDEPMMEDPTGKEIDYTSLVVDGIDTRDYPDFADAYFASGEYMDGTPIPDEVLDELTQDGDLLYDHIQKRLYEAEYHGRNVSLGKPFLTPDGPKKRSVYVKNPKGNVVKVNFGDKKLRIKKSNPKRRKSFRARHNCANPGPRHKARYWSCRAW